MDENSPLVSVIIPTYKRPNMLRRAIESVLDQTYKNIEIIIVDDNNKDSIYRNETILEMEKYTSNQNIKYIKHSINKGGAEARNTGIRSSSGKYITFLDDDDEYLPGKIEKQVEKFKESDLKNLGFVYCQMDIYDENNQYLRSTQNYFRGHKIPFEQNMFYTIAGTPSIMVLKTVLLEVGGFKNLSSGQDWYLTLEILANGYSADYIKGPSLLNVYAHNEERITTDSNKVETLIERFDIKKKFFNRLSEDIKVKVTYKHFMQIANFLKTSNKNESFVYFLKAFKYKKIDKANITYLLSLIEPKIIRNIRRTLLKLH